MIVELPRVELGRADARLVARVRSESGAFEPFDFRIGVLRAFIGWIDRSGTPWVPPLLLLAGRLRERLVIEAPVSPRLLAGAEAACAVFARWWDVRPVRLEAPAAPADGRPRGLGKALFFTRGVDSWFSALRAVRGELTVTHLLYSSELDRQYSAANRHRAIRLTEEAARQLELPLVHFSTNARELLDRFVNWEDTHGGVLAAVGLALGNWFSEVVVPSANDLENLAPHGTHPDLDPLWSTEHTGFRSDGAATTRTEKVRSIATSPVALPLLKVCWEADIATNCGRCPKCLRTLTALALAGALDRATSFERPLASDSFASLRRPRRDRPKRSLVELYESFPPDPALADLREALRSRLPAWHPEAPSEISRPAGARAVVIEHAPQWAVHLVPVPVRTTLPGPLVARGTIGDGARLQISWAAPTDGEISIPWRPTARERDEIVRRCRSAAERPVPWCVLDYAGRDAAEVVGRLSESWGNGLVIAPRHEALDSDHGTARAIATAVQERSAVRAWRGSGVGIDPFRMVEALRHGCLPLQCVSEAEYDELRGPVPDGILAFTLCLPRSGPLPLLDAPEREARFHRGLSLVLAGSLERDLTIALARVDEAEAP